MNLTLPLNFGERQCDRLLLARLRPMEPSAVLWMAFLVWRDFAIARDDRRKVPSDAPLRVVCEAVMILEQYCGWQGPPGVFVETGIATGFFELVRVDDGESELMLVDFFPANHAAARSSASKLGGMMKSVNLSRTYAAVAAKEQLSLFEQQASPLLAAHGKKDLKEAAYLIHQLCRILNRASPVAEEWKGTLINKAVGVLSRHPKADMECAFKWLVANRDSQLVPPRLDFVLDGFDDFIARGRKEFP